MFSSMLKKIVPLAFILMFAGCASTSYTYHDKSVPLKKGVTKYQLKNVVVNLHLGSNAIEGDASFASQDELKEQFTESLQKHLKENNILDTRPNADSVQVSVTIDYTRKYTYGGKALVKPEISHSVLVSQGDVKLASFGQSDYTTKYGYLKDSAVNLKIATHQWDAENEPEDVDLISSLIVKDLFNLGH